MKLLFLYLRRALVGLRAGVGGPVRSLAVLVLGVKIAFPLLWKLHNVWGYNLSSGSPLAKDHEGLSGLLKEHYPIDWKRLCELMAWKHTGEWGMVMCEPCDGEGCELCANVGYLRAVPANDNHPAHSASPEVNA